MKKLKNLLAMIAIAAFVFSPLLGNALTVSAAEPATYCLKYVDGEWRYQPGSSWKSDGYHRELYYFNQEIKEGDQVVVEGSGSEVPLNIPVKISNLTINQVSFCSVVTKGIDTCYVLGNSTCAINGDVSKAYVYNTSCCNFNNNVGYLELIGTTDVTSTIAVLGTADHVYAKDDTRVYYDLYQFTAGKLRIEDGSLRTENKYYSTTAPAATATNTANTTPKATNTSEYDDVPKTGEVNYFPLLLSVMGCAAAMKLLLRKYSTK